MTGTRDGALRRAAGHFDDGGFMADLARRVAIPTESQEPDRRAELHRYLADEIAPSLQPHGFTRRIFDNPDPAGGPFLIAERVEGPARPTLLTYGHGDVVRGIPEQWREGLEPWRIIRDGERHYGRGTADNKGQHSIVMAALAAVLAERGRLGFNARLLIEMSEEIGSPGLDAFCQTHGDALAADLLLACDGPRMKAARADVKLGNRGALAFDLRVDLREGSRHSGHWGGVLADPGIILAHALATITTAKGRILVPEWLPDGIPAPIREALKGFEIDPGGDFPAIDPDWGEPGLSRAEKMLAWTSFIVLAFVTGRPENPVNGVQPEAWARCQLRFSADVDPHGFLPALRRHLDRHGLAQVEVRDADQGYFPAWRTDPRDPWVEWAVGSIAATTGERPNLVPNSAGGLPSEIFGRTLGVPVLWVPHSYTGCCQHGPNEHVLAPIMRDGLRIMTGLFWDLGALDAPFGR
ncbi:MAG: M20 family metallopeptidase [Alphaproteobacteria bacterium]